MDSKAVTRQKIIDTAKLIFLEKGLFDTVMEDIADGVGLTRRTMYRYFKTKEDLAYETTIILLNAWNGYYLELFEALKGNGLEQLDHFLKGLLHYMRQRIDEMKYLGEFDFYFKDDSQKKAGSESMKRFNDIILESDRLLTTIIKRGIEDGSIMKGIPVEKTVATISNVLWSFGQRIAIRGHIIETETGLDPLDLIAYQMDLYCIALKGGQVSYETF